MKRQITIIPPDPKYDNHIKVEQKKLNVAAYCRVSTRFEQQEQSYESQVKYYTDKIGANTHWTLVNIYADDGKTATSTTNRDSFNDMLKDCKLGKIDLILTKSISRFARNTVDLLGVVRDLKSKNIRIVFEKENIDTLDSTGEILLTILSSQAQEESRNTSENTHWGLIRQFEQGIFHVNYKRFLGYTKGDDGKLEIVPKEAELVKKIFKLFLDGKSTYRIAKILESENIVTVTGNSNWHAGTLKRMLMNEKYIGDALMQKTFTVDFMLRKRMLNNGQLAKYHIKNCHEPIIDWKSFEKVQQRLNMIKRKKAVINTIE